MATGKLIGHNGQNENSAGGYGPYFVLLRYTAEAAGTLSEIRIKAKSSGNVKVGFYADNSGEPGARLAKKDASTAVVAGWNTITLESSVSIAKDTDYWLALALDTAWAAYENTLSGPQRRVKVITYSSFAFPDPASGPWDYNDIYYPVLIQGYGILVLSPSSISQPLSYGSPKLNLSIKPSSILQALAYGTPIVLSGTIIIQPSSIVQSIAVGAPVLRYPQTLSPPGIIVTIAYGTPSVGIFGIIKPESIVQQISLGSPTVLKYVWHVILDGQYNIDSPEVNRAYVIGQDSNGNPVYGTANDATEGALVGERLDFQQELAIPLTAQAAEVAAAILSKIRITTKKGLILIPPNCGQELFDVVQITDSGANQAAVSFRVVGLRFEYNPKRAHYLHTLILGAP